MIDVQVRVRVAPRHHHINEGLKDAALRESIKGPVRGILGLPVFVQRHVAKKIFKTALFEERIGFEV